MVAGICELLIGTLYVSLACFTYAVLVKGDELREEGRVMMRARFTTDEIAVAALRMVDEAGLGALSMRSLAAALGTGPMTLYNYVADKEGLEELVVAAIVSEVRLPESDRRLAAGRARHRQRDVAGHPSPPRGDPAGADPPNVLVDWIRASPTRSSRRWTVRVWRITTGLPRSMPFWG